MALFPRVVPAAVPTALEQQKPPCLRHCAPWVGLRPLCRACPPPCGAARTRSACGLLAVLAGGPLSEGQGAFLPPLKGSAAALTGFVFQRNHLAPRRGAAGFAPNRSFRALATLAKARKTCRLPHHGAPWTVGYAPHLPPTRLRLANGEMWLPPDATGTDPGATRYASQMRPYRHQLHRQACGWTGALPPGSREPGSPASSSLAGRAAPRRLRCSCGSRTLATSCYTFWVLQLNTRGRHDKSSKPASTYRAENGERERRCGYTDFLASG